MSEDLHSSVGSLRRLIASLRSDTPYRTTDLTRKLKRVLGVMPMFPGQFLYIYNFSEARLVHTKGFQDVLGIPDDQVDMELLYRLWHPDDAPIVASLNQVVVKAMMEIKHPAEPFELTMTVDYRVRKANGDYIRVLRQTGEFEVDEASGRVISVFSLCKVIDRIKTNDRIGWQLGGRSAEKLDMSELGPIIAKIEYQPSAREMDVIRKLAEGKSSKQIAQEMRVSVHTVSAHRRNLLSRTGLRNTAELVNRLRPLG